MATLRARSLAKRHRVTHGARFRLADQNPGDTGSIGSKERAQKLLARGIQRLRDAQERLYAQDNWSVLLIFQAMDAAGKDGAIEHVMSGVNPQGCQVFSFKAPSEEELDHDFMWRTSKNLPERGRIGIFNRSYYEEVLVVRVHPEILQRQKLPAKLVARNIWKQRFADIVAFERYLARNGVVVLKFFLNVSKEEQQRRFLSRIDEPSKQWKFSGADVRERAFWNDYMRAYEDMIRHTASAHAPWYVVPADNKWYTRLVVASAVIDALDDLHLAFARGGAGKNRELAEAKRALEKEALRGAKSRRRRK
jgi:PPK2 family polyphosphate:nucleotide phosphotransferase